MLTEESNPFRAITTVTFVTARTIGPKGIELRPQIYRKASISASRRRRQKIGRAEVGEDMWLVWECCGTSC